MSDKMLVPGAIDARSMMLFDANKKSVGVAYLLWLFLGGLGGHRFYAGKTGTAIVILVLTIAGFSLLLVGIGFIFLALVGVWVIVDAFLIPGWVRNHNNLLAMQLGGR